MKYYRTEKQRLFIVTSTWERQGFRKLFLFQIGQFQIGLELSCRYRCLLFNFHKVEKATSISFSSRLDYYHF